MVWTAGATRRRNDRRGGDRLGQLANDLIHARTNAFLISIHDFASDQRHVFSLEIQVLDQIVINAFDFIWPFLVVRV